MIINLNGLELDFEMTDVDFYERYMENAEKLDKVMGLELTDEDKQNYHNIVKLFRKRCTAMREFLDHLFGEGTGSKVCGEKDNIEVCLDIYMTMCDGVKQDSDRLSGKFPGLR